MTSRAIAPLLLALATSALPGCVWEAWQDGGREGESSAPSDPSSPSSGFQSSGFSDPTPASPQWDAFMDAAPPAPPRSLDTLDGTWTGSATDGVDVRLRFESGTLVVGVRCGDRTGGFEVPVQVREGISSEVVFASSAKFLVRATPSGDEQLVCEVGVAAGSATAYVSGGRLGASFLSGQIGVASRGYAGSPSYRASLTGVSLAKIAD